MNKFEKVCEMSLNEWLATIPDEIPEAEYTENHEKWLKKLFNKMRNDRYHRFTTKTVKVLMVAAILSALLLTAFVIPSSREYIIENFDVFSTYKLSEINDNSVNGEISVGYIPEGYELESSVVKDKYVYRKYISNENKYFTIIKQTSATTVEFDTEMGKVEEIIINGNSYVLYHSLEYICVVWNENDYVYQMHSSMSKEELLKIVSSIN